ncbi:MAG: NAD-dependent epimerase/dehydratase family protein [Halobacteriales archaeon]
MRTVVVTGGSGAIGPSFVESFSAAGYRTVNVDVTEPDRRVADRYLEADLRDPGEVYGALSAADADAVVHLGTIDTPTNHPGHVTFESNAMSSYFVLEAAESLGIRSVALASSINALGAKFQDAPMDVRYLPIDESHPATPRDPYGLGKRAIEEVAAGFGRREAPPTSVSTLRFPNVDVGGLERYAEADCGVEALRRRHEYPSHVVRSLTYVHAADAATLARLALEADLGGHETFWAVADDTTSEVPTPELAAAFYPDAERRRPLVGTESPITNAKAGRLLGWEPERSWRA